MAKDRGGTFTGLANDIHEAYATFMTPSDEIYRGTQIFTPALGEAMKCLREYSIPENKNHGYKFSSYLLFARRLNG